MPAQSGPPAQSVPSALTHVFRQSGLTFSYSDKWFLCPKPKFKTLIAELKKVQASDYADMQFDRRQAHSPEEQLSYDAEVWTKQGLKVLCSSKIKFGFDKGLTGLDVLVGPTDEPGATRCRDRHIYFLYQDRLYLISLYCGPKSFAGASADLDALLPTIKIDREIARKASLTNTFCQSGLAFNYSDNWRLCAVPKSASAIAEMKNIRAWRDYADLLFDRSRAATPEEQLAYDKESWTKDGLKKVTLHQIKFGVNNEISGLEAIVRGTDAPGGEQSVSRLIYFARQGKVYVINLICGPASFTVASEDLNALLPSLKIETEIASVKELPVTKPNSVQSFNDRGLFLYKHKDAKGAKDAFAHSVKLDPTNVWALNYLGLANEQLREWKEANDAFVEAIRWSGDVWSLNESGLMLRKLGDRKKAEAQFRKAVKFDPYYSSAINNLGVVQEEQGDLEAAEDTFRAAVKFKRSPLSWCNLGSVLVERGKIDDAAAVYQQALDCDKDCAAAWSGMGTVLRVQKKIAQSEKAYRHALSLDSHFALAWCALATLLEKNGNVPGAVAAYKRAVKENPDFGKAWCSLGMCLRDQGKAADAHASLLKALSCSSAGADDLSSVGYALEALGDGNNSKRAYSVALDRQPQETDVLLEMRNAFTR
jgi:tetratricopeptide (TPR) repeat protein